MTESDFTEKASQAVTLLATGLMQLEKESDNGTILPLPLKESLRQGWELLSYLCFSTGVLPPRTFPELVTLLHQPVRDWRGMTPYFPSSDYVLPLLAEGRPTALCVELGGPFVNFLIARLELEDAHFRKIYECCQGLAESEQYSLVREFINRNVVLEDVYASITNNRRWREEIRPLLQPCFERISRPCLRRDEQGEYIMQCPHCSWPLEWRGSQAFCYRGGQCADFAGNLAEFGVRRPYLPGMARTTEGIQKYVAAPEQSLIAIVDALTPVWGVRLTLYPRLDAYDLLIEFVNGRRWAVDLKDHHHAALLAVRLPPFAYDPPWDRAFYVFPDYRADYPAYLNEFGNYWRRQKDVNYVGVRQLIALAKEEASR